MSLAGQRIQPDRYSLVPRTLSFLMRDSEILLLRLPRDRGDWSGLYNGIGGHIEQGEDPWTAAKREILEETGFVPWRLRLCGVIAINTGKHVGVGLYVFVGEVKDGEIHASTEGEPRWIPLEQLEQTPVVEDIPTILPKAIDSYKSMIPFSALYEYNMKGELSIQFAQ